MKKWYLLAYDIRHPKRLRLVHYFLKKHGLAMQYSVFLLQVNGHKLEEILKGVKERVNGQEDDVRLYPIAHPASIWTAGKQVSKVTNLYPVTDEKQESIWDKISGFLKGKKTEYVIGNRQKK